MYQLPSSYQCHSTCSMTSKEHSVLQCAHMFWKGHRCKWSTKRHHYSVTEKKRICLNERQEECWPSNVWKAQQRNTAPFRENRDGAQHKQNTSLMCRCMQSTLNCPQKSKGFYQLSLRFHIQGHFSGPDFSVKTYFSVLLWTLFLYSTGELVFPNNLNHKCSKNLPGRNSQLLVNLCMK